MPSTQNPKLYNSKPLPVDLLDFRVETAGSNARLNWLTASERNAAFFAIERMEENGNWPEIGRVTAAGQADNVTNYTFLDRNLPAASTVFYRLRQTDLDGSFSYSPIVSLQLGREDFTVYPNI